MSFSSVFPTKLPLLAGKRIITLTFTESIGFTDYGIYSRSIAKTFSERVGLSEASFKTITKPFTESIGISDKGITKTASKTFAEAIGLKDYGVYSKSITKTFSDSVGLLEAITKSLSKTISESIGLSDKGIIKSLTRQFTESIGLRETASKQLSKSFTEAIGLYEYWGYMYPYYDPRQALDKLIKILQTAKALGIRADILLENPYIVYLIRMMAKKMSGEA